MIMTFLRFIYPQVTPNAGKTSVYQETPITWWAPTVCPCWSTTSEESNSWSVTERERAWTLLQLFYSGGGICTIYEVLILPSFLWWTEASLLISRRTALKCGALLFQLPQPLFFFSQVWFCLFLYLLVLEDLQKITKRVSNCYWNAWHVPHITVGGGEEIPFLTFVASFSPND